MRDKLRTYPARRLTPDEHALVAEWLAAAGDIASAYVANRRNDDPDYYQRVVITSVPGEDPSHVVHAAPGRDIWMVFTAGRRTRVQRFPTLRAALNAIRPVLVDSRPDDPGPEGPQPQHASFYDDWYRGLRDTDA